MSDPNGWPDPTRPGVPLNPERSGWHWLRHPEDLRPMVAGWDAELHGWPSGALHSPQGIVDLGYRYLGPALLPAEVAAREAAAYQRGAEAMREKALLATESVSEPRDAMPRDMAQRPRETLVLAAVLATKREAASAIRALPIPEDKP